MTTWHKWSERKPTEADALHGLIECAWDEGGRFFATPTRYDWDFPPPAYWRTPAPLPGEEAGPAEAVIVNRCVPIAERSDAVRVLEALVESAKRTMIFNHDAVNVSAERYHCAVDTYQTFVAALAAVKAQEEGK